MIEAIRSGKKTLAEYQLEWGLTSGGDPNSVVAPDDLHSNMRFSLLSYAIQRGNSSAARSLLEKGANPNGSKGETDEFPLWWAASKGNLGITMELVSRGADVNGRRKGLTETTALHAAIYFDHAEIVRYLIDNGADVKKRTLENNRWGVANATPLELARKLGRPECERELMRKVQ